MKPDTKGHMSCDSTDRKCPAWGNASRRKAECWAPGAGGRAEWEATPGHRVPLGGDESESVLELDNHDRRTLNVLTATESCTLKEWVLWYTKHLVKISKFLKCLPCMHGVFVLKQCSFDVCVKKKHFFFLGIYHGILHCPLKVKCEFHILMRLLI